MYQKVTVRSLDDVSFHDMNNSLSGFETFGIQKSELRVEPWMESTAQKLL